MYGISKENRKTLRDLSIHADQGAAVESTGVSFRCGLAPVRRSCYILSSLDLQTQLQPEPVDAR
jgi:hypothetical protein